jgi:hypothetical protein
LIAAWAAVTVAAVTVVANVLGVWWVSRTQRRIARAERIGDREIEVYVDLLRWVKEIESISQKRNLAPLEAIKVLELPTDLDVRITAFASETVRQRVQDFQEALFQMHQRFSRDEQSILLLFKEALETQDFSRVLAAVPEYDTAVAATQRISQAVREAETPTAQTLAWTDSPGSRVSQPDPAR